MEAIDQAAFRFSQTAGVAVGVMVGFLVFAVALDLTWAQFRRVLRTPAAPGVGLFAQFVVLPAAAFGVGVLLVETPSIALGLVLVACCPAGALSNYLTGVARGDVATSISMTAVSTVVSAVMTPLLFAFWTSMNPATSGLLRAIEIDPRRAIAMLMIMLVVPVSSGMLLRAKRPATAEAIRRWVRRIAMIVFACVVAVILGSNLDLLVGHARQALAPVLVTFVLAGSLGWGLAWVTQRPAEERRAVVLEVCLQNVALALAMAVAFFPTLAGVAITAALWGVVHLIFGTALAVVWQRIRIPSGSVARTQKENSDVSSLVS